MDTEMKILFIAPRYEGGTGGHASKVAEKLNECGFDVTLMHAPHIPVKKLKNLSFALFSSIKAILQREKFDVVHAFNVPSAFAMKYCNAEKKVLSIYGVYSEQIGILYSNTAETVAKSIEVKAIKWADRLTTDSMAVKKQYKEKLGVDFEFLYSPLVIERFKHIPDVPKKKNQVIFIGRDSFEKGIDILRDIEPRINGNVVYCTDLPWAQAMKKLKESEILVIPSRMESSPQVIREAFYLKVPIIATRVGGIPELITDKENGILVEPENPDELLDSINGLLASGDTKLADKGYDFVMNNLTWESLLPKYVQFYKGLAGQLN